MSEKGVVLGHGLRILKQASRTDPTASSVHESSPEHKGSTNRYLGPVSTKPSTYLSNFIIYVATIGDIVDGADTTHDFNYFSLVYERPKDVRSLTSQLKYVLPLFTIIRLIRFFF
jgi:zinc finger FYVE domain-containing protein 26